jgi:hypothetical protein
MKLGFLTEKAGPLPVYGWIAIGAAAYFLIIRPRLAGSAQAQPQQPSYVAVPNQGGGGTNVSTPPANPIDFSPITGALTQLGSQMQTDFGALGTQISGLQTASAAPIPPSQQQQQAAATSIIPAGFSLYTPSLSQPIPQYTWAANPPPTGQTPATVNADLVARWTAAGLTPSQIAAQSGLSNPGAHSSLSSYP